MAYCPRCGKKNEDDARFCNSCGAPIAGAAPPQYRREMGGEKCEEECSGGKHRASAFWGIIIILIGLWIVFQLGVTNIKGLPPEVTNFEFWWIFPVVIGIVVVALGIMMIARRTRVQ